MPSSQWATEENSKSLWYEQSSYASTHIASIGYGIHASVYTVVMYFMIKQRKTQGIKKFTGQVIFNTLLFVLGTVNLACSIQYNENAWINLRNYPGGPAGYLFDQQNAPVMTIGNSASILISIIADGLLLYRVLLLWNYRWYIVIFNTLFYIATVLLSILIVIQIAIPSSGMPSISLAVWIIIMVVNIVFTAQIAGRILFHRRKLVDALGPEHASMYTGIVAVVIESALPFTIISIVLLGLFGDNNTAQNLFISLLLQLECIGPELIMLRVVLGRAWTLNTINGIDLSSSIKFGTDSVDKKECGGSTETVVGESEAL